MQASSTDSVTKMADSGKCPAPRAFISPTSSRRSNIAVAIAAATASPDVNSAASVISSIKPLIRESTVPSFCAIRLICSA